MAFLKQVGVAVASTLALVVVAGCGAEPSAVCAPVAAVPALVAATPSPTPTWTPKVVPTKVTKAAVPAAAAKIPATVAHAAAPTPKPSATVAPTPAVTLADLLAAHDDLTTTQTLNTVTDNKKDGSKQVQTKTTTRFKSPGTYAIEVTDSNNGKTGTRVLFDYGSANARVKGGGILGIATLTFKLTDGLLLSTNGWRLDQVVVKGLLARLTGGGYEAQTAGTSTIGDTPITVLKVTNSQNALDADIAYELVGFDADKQVRLWSAYGKPSLGLPHDLMYQLILDSVDSKATLPTNAFQL